MNKSSSANLGWLAAIWIAALVAIVASWIAGGIGFGRAHPGAAVGTIRAARFVSKYDGPAMVDSTCSRRPRSLGGLRWRTLSSV